MTKMSKILWEGHALSTDRTLPRAYEASILNPLHYKFLATPLSVPLGVDPCCLGCKERTYKATDGEIISEEFQPM